MLKTIDEIYKEMLSVFAEASGYLPSSSCDLAARLYAAAAQIHGLLLQAQWVLEQGFPQTAQGEYLERLAALRGINRSIATCATGMLRFGVSDAVGGDLSIRSGTTCMTDTGIRFATTEDAVTDGINFYDLRDFSLVICKPDRKVIYSGCQWSAIQEEGQLNAMVAEKVTVVASKRIETTA